MTRLLSILLGIGLVVGGCARREPPHPLGSEAFYTAAPDEAAADARADATEDAAPSDVARPVPSPQVAAPATAPLASPATAPAAQGASSGQYLTLGGVVAEVNNTPIYAHQVLDGLESVLAAQARDARGLEEFRTAARQQIARQVQQLIGDELEFAAAQQHLEQRDKDLAWALTERWRQGKITEAGGSEEVARRLAAEQGEDFDELVRQEYRRNMQTLYYQKRVYPHVQITASDMRQFYERNRDTLFTEHDRARFRVIKIDPKEMGGREQALEKIRGLRQRVVETGESFADVAGSVNHDRYLLQNKGDVGNGGMLARGSYVVEEVEEAVWQLQPKEVTEVVEANGAFYIAKLEERENGRVAPFEEQAVQAAVRRELEARQVRELRERVIRRLQDAAIITTDEGRMEAVVEMAVQRYPQWAGQG